MSNAETKYSSDSTKAVPSISCESCGSVLVTDFILGSQSTKVSLRCGGCGDLIGTRIKANAPVDKRARWSLWLGLSSILLLFITGIPAMYLGIRSLLRMRYTSFRLQDRRAAIVGTALGSLFGICGGFCGGGAIALSVVAFLSSSETRDLKQTLVVFEGVATGDIPKQMKQGFAIRAVNTHQFNFRDAKLNKDRTCRVHIVYFPPVMVGGMATLKQTLRLHKISNDSNHEPIEETTLNWEIAGESVVVYKYVMKETYENDKGETVTNEVHQYLGYAHVEEGIYGVTCAIRVPNQVFPDEESIKSFFSSIGPAEKIDAAGAWKAARLIPITEDAGEEQEDNDPENATDERESTEEDSNQIGDAEEKVDEEAGGEEQGDGEKSGTETD